MGLDLPLANWLAILAAAVAAWIFGAIYYTALSKVWLDALGTSAEALRQPGRKMSPAPFILSFVAELVMAWVLLGIVGHIGQPSLKAGLVTAGLCWLGFVATTVAVNNAYPGRKPTLTLIDAAHWLGVMLIQGAVIGLLATRG